MAGEISTASIVDYVRVFHWLCFQVREVTTIRKYPLVVPLSMRGVWIHGALDAFPEASVAVPPVLFSWQAFTMDDAYHKGTWNGVALTLTFKGAKNKHVRVATAITPEENAYSYNFVLRNTTRFPPMRDILKTCECTSFVDGRKGSNSALSFLCPLTEDRACVHYLLENVPAG